ncbi:hypothetical protein ZWY2020_049359 [Hordeum vulgare]|nr:hypothetical protein ZWY2020_049359 [Hordeum vulgare]
MEWVQKGRPVLRLAGEEQVPGVVLQQRPGPPRGGQRSPPTRCHLSPTSPRKGQPIQFPMNKECSDIGCCSASIPKGYTSYSIQVQAPGNVSEFDAESSVYITEEGSYNVTHLIFKTVNTLTVLLDWVISNSTCGKELPGMLKALVSVRTAALVRTTQDFLTKGTDVVATQATKATLMLWM